MTKHKSKTLKRLNHWWLRYEYKHTTLAILAIWLFILLLDSALLAAIFSFAEDMGLLGGFVAGVLSVSFFTAAPAVVLLVGLATHAEPYWLALAWAVGSTLGDWLILRFYQEKVTSELRPLFKRLRMRQFVRLLRHRYTSWILFLFGAVIIATPLPDEVGLGLMGASRLRQRYIIFMCFMLNALGALAIILAARALQA